MSDIMLHYIEKGHGAPLVLLHGNEEDSTYFKNQLCFFAQSFRVLAVDTRGHGASPRGDAPFTLAQFAEDLKDFLDGQQIEKANILGFSDGGNIALLFALKYPQYLDKLILNGANLSPAGVKVSVQLPTCVSYYIASLASLFHKRSVSKKEILGLMVKEPHIAPTNLSAITTPTLVIAGTHDMIRTQHTRQIAAALPNARLRVIDGDHFIASTNSDAFNREVMEFLATGNKVHTDN